MVVKLTRPKYWIHLVILTFLSSLLILFWTPALAQEKSDRVTKIPGSLILPTSPFYFIKGWLERLELTVAVDLEKKALVHVRISQARLSEIDDALINLRFDDADRGYEAYKNHITQAQNALRKTGKVNFNKDISKAVENNTDYIDRLKSRFPERSTLLKTFTLQDQTHELLAVAASSQIVIVSPIALNDLKKFQFVFDIRSEDKFKGMHVPGAIFVPYLDDPKFPMDDFLKNYPESSSFLVVGDNTSQVLIFAQRVINNPLGKDRKIYVLENGLMDYIKYTNLPLDGVEARP